MDPVTTKSTTTSTIAPPYSADMLAEMDPAEVHYFNRWDNRLNYTTLDPDFQQLQSPWYLSHCSRILQGQTLTAFFFL